MSSPLMNLRSSNSGAPFLADNNGDTLIFDLAQKKWGTGPAVGGVASVFGRTGAVVAVTGDYDSDQVVNISTVPGAAVSDALDYLLANAGAVASVFGRVGVVVAATGDYDSDQVDNVSGVAGASVSDALDTLAAATGVSSVFGRTGVVIAQDNDYTASRITGGMQQVADLAGRNGIPLANRQVGQTIYEVDTDQLWRLIGGTGNGNWVDVTIGLVTNARAGIVPGVGAVGTILQSTGTASAWVSPLLYDSTNLSPTITQTLTAGATGQTMRVAAQNAATTGGALELATGTGGTTPGEFRMFAGATKFGSIQLSNANDFFALGANPSATGVVRLPPGNGIRSREFAFGSDLDVYVSGTGDNQQTFGSLTSTATRIRGPAGGGVAIRAGASDCITVSSTTLSIILATTVVGAAAAASGYTFSIVNSNSGANAGGFFRIRAMGTTSGNTNGASVQLEGGRLNGTGLSGGVVLKLNQDDTQPNMWPMVEVTHLGANRRVVAVCMATAMTSAAAPTGDLMLLIGNSPAAPTSAPVGCGELYVLAGALRYRGTANTDTLLGPA